MCLALRLIFFSKFLVVYYFFCMNCIYICLWYLWQTYDGNTVAASFFSFQCQWSVTKRSRSLAQEIEAHCTIQRLCICLPKSQVFLHQDCLLYVICECRWCILCPKYPLLVLKLTSLANTMEEILKVEVPCHGRCGSIQIHFSSMTGNAERGTQVFSPPCLFLCDIGCNRRLNVKFSDFAVLSNDVSKFQR